MGTAVAVDGKPEGAAPPERPRFGLAAPWLPEVVLVAIAALLSFPRLGSRSLWLDEAYTVGATNQVFDNWRSTEDGAQALHYLLMWPVTRLSTDPAWIRLPSAFLGLAALVVVFRLARRVGSQREAVLAAGGLALSWGLARYSIEARTYTLTLLLVSTSWLALIAATQADTDDESRRWWRIFYAATVLAQLAHGLATLNFVAQVAALAIAPDDQRRLLRRALLVAPVLALQLVVLFLIGAEDVGDWVPPLSLNSFVTIKQLLLGFGVTGAVLACLTVVAVVDVVRRFVRERSYETWIRVLPVFWALGPPIMVVVLSLLRPYAAPRYVFASLPGFFLLIAGLVVRLESTKRVALASSAIGVLLLVDQPNVTTNSIEDWSGLTACIAANAREGDRLVTDASHRSALDYYWLDHPELSAVEPLAPPEPLGEVVRLYEMGSESREAFRSLLLEDTSGSIWYMDRGKPGRLSVVGLAFDREVNERYVLHDAWYFRGQLTLVRLDPVAIDRPRSEASCSTVETPADMRPPDE